MLLRSVTKHIKNQDWLAVAIDFFIVVAGILIALQITNWNESRQALERERGITLRLATDFASQERLLLARIERAVGLTKSSGELLTLIRAGEEPAEPERVKYFIFQCLNTTFREAPPASYSELLASGSLLELSDQTLREALVRYGQSVARWDYLEGQARAQKDEQSAFRRAIKIAIDTAAFDQGDWSVKPSAVKEFDWEQLRRAEVSIETIQQHQWEQLDLHQKDLNAVRDVIEALRDDA